jgi:hypothetical protein
VPLVTFDGAQGTTFDFTVLNDPVMGGRSHGTWALEAGYGVLDGAVVDVPSLKAPVRCQGFKCATPQHHNLVTSFAYGYCRASSRRSLKDRSPTPRVRRRAA